LWQASKPILGRGNQFYGRHKGEACYILGDGISVKSMNLASFSNNLSIALNYIPLHKDFSSLNCPYYVVPAPYLFSPYFGYSKPMRRHLNIMAKIIKEVVISRQEMRHFISLSNYPFVRAQNVFYLFQKISDSRLNTDFISNQINCFSGALRSSICLAIYMGFDQIKLVGCDYTHTPSKSRHWYEAGEGNNINQTGYEKDFFEIAKQFIDITTITLDSTSEFIDAVTYKDYTGIEPVFRENNELSEDRYLRALDTFSGNRIYEK
jgi:hypothetical protein